MAYISLWRIGQGLDSESDSLSLCLLKPLVSPERGTNFRGADAEKPKGDLDTEAQGLVFVNEYHSEHTTAHYDTHHSKRAHHT